MILYDKANYFLDTFLLNTLLYYIYYSNSILILYLLYTYSYSRGGMVL
jgi:hypothetical protein